MEISMSLLMEGYMEKVISKEFVFVCRDSMDTCAKYVRASNIFNMVDIQVLYRFGKPSIYQMTLENFLAERKENNSKYTWRVSHG
jgi:hypothetical protein